MIRETKRLDEIGTIVTGTTPQSSLLHSGARVGIPFLTPTDIQHRELSTVTERFLAEDAAAQFSTRLVPAGATAVTCIGASIGKTTMTKMVSLTNQQVNSVIPSPDYDQRFVYYSILTVVDHFADIAGGSATPILNKSAFSEIRIPVAPIDTQKGIALVLGTLDDKIAADTSAMCMAEQLIDALVYENVSTSCSVSIADELILHYGKSLPASKRVPGQIPVVGSGGIVGWHSSPLIEDPTVVVGRKGSIGALHWIDSSSFPIDTTFWVQPTRLPTRILYSLLKLVDFSGSNTDSAVPGLNRSVAYEMPLPFISEEAVAAVWDQVSSLDALCSHLKREVACLTKTRDELLPLLMSGKITVREAEQEAATAGADIAGEESEA